MSDALRGLPGDPDPRNAVERMIRVDHAGEYGAVRIYAGQLAVLGRSEEAPAIRAMAEKEREHLAALADAAISFVHVGVEAHWWPSPLPECAAPHFAGGSIAERLASMPLRPAKPCDEAAYLIPGLPISMAAMNLMFAVGAAAVLSFFLWRDARRPA